jgi:hypothetical protein
MYSFAMSISIIGEHSRSLDITIASQKDKRLFIWRTGGARKTWVKIENEMDAPSFDEFAEFIRQWARISRKKRIAPETEFEDGLGITGDDGSDLLRATEKRFEVALSSEEYGYRKTFNLGPDEFLFHGEGLWPDVRTLFGRSAPVVVAFTVGALYEAVQKALVEKAAGSV